MVSNRFLTGGRITRPPPSCISPPTPKKKPATSHTIASTSGGEANASATITWTTAATIVSTSGGEANGSATITSTTTWTIGATSGGEANGSATITTTKAWTISTSSGGEANGSATITSTRAWTITASSGGETNGSATITSGGTAYCQSTNTDTGCDPASGGKYDLGAAVGSGTSTFIVGSTLMIERVVWDFAWTPKDGAIGISLNVTTLNGTNATYQFRAQALNSLCVVLANSAYSSQFTTTGVKTMTGTLTGTTGANRLRISLEASRTGIGPPPMNSVVTDNASSFITYPI